MLARHRSDVDVIHRLSPFIDLLRLALALWVALGHMQWRGLVDLPAGAMVLRTGHEAVILFFVLSGLVISDAARRKHGDLRTYAIARIARVCSVAIPALVLTIALDAIALGFDPGAAGKYPIWQYDNFWAHFLVHAAFLGQLWGLSITPFSNVPYWSLSYEVWYYALFGVAFYLRGARRVITVGVIVTMMGPKLWLLLPCWWAGVTLARDADRLVLSPARGALLAGICLAALIVMHSGGFDIEPTRITIGPVTAIGDAWIGQSRWFLVDWLTAAFFALFLAGFAATGVRLPAALAWRIRHWAGASFSLYLVHMPVIMLLVTAGSIAGHWFFASVVALCTIGTVTVAFSAFTERRLVGWAKALRAADAKIRGRLGQRYPSSPSTSPRM